MKITQGGRPSKKQKNPGYVRGLFDSSRFHRPDNRRLQRRPPATSRMPRSVVTERENLRRQRLRIERDPIQQRGERELALVSADDDDAAGDVVEFIGSQS